MPLLGEKGQLLFGTNGQWIKDSVTKNNDFVVNFGLRAYYGRNDIKGFLLADLNTIITWFRFIMLQ